ncbi:MAG TPA: glycosyltransferase family 4 protein [Nostocaceae cyanobacterium]|nr:glycosyltransferase family 4 protein [Nostocaceae cyanobacterium]
MHIIVLENETSSLRGGQELSLFDVCLGLNKRGHEITLVYLKAGNLLDEYSKFCTKLIQVRNFRIERQKIFNSFQNILIDIIKIKTTQNSLVYTNQYHDSFFAYLLASIKNIPFVSHLRLPPPETKLGWQWNLAMKKATRLIAVSKQTKLDWIQAGFAESKIDVVYNGINTEKFHICGQRAIIRKEWGISEDAEIISYVGRLDQEKGLEILLQGFAKLLKNGRNAKLLIAGKPLCQTEEYKKSLEQLVIKLEITNSVQFLNHLTNPVPLYQLSDVTVLCSLHSEPFGRCIVESMACGTPVVASRTGGITEILTQDFQGMLFEPGNIQDLVKTLNLVLDWRKSDPLISLKFRQHVLDNFNVDRMVNGIESILVQN